MTNFHLIPLLCLVLTFRSMAWSVECPSGFVMFRDSCYYFSEDAKSWTSALAACQDLGATLVEINTPVENDFIIDTVYELKADMWTGGSDRANEGVYVWEKSQTPLEDMGTWEPKNPSGGGEDCIEMNYRLVLPDVKPQWNDRRCSKILRYICEKSFTCTFDP